MRIAYLATLLLCSVTALSSSTDALADKTRSKTHTYRKKSAAEADDSNPPYIAAVHVYRSVTGRKAEDVGRSEKFLLMENALRAILYAPSPVLRQLGAKIPKLSAPLLQDAIKTFLERDVTDKEKARVAFLAAAMAWAKDETHKTIKMAARSTRLDPQYAKAFQLLARSYERVGKPEKARSALVASLKAAEATSDMIQKTEIYASASGMLAKLDLQQGDITAAAGHIKKCHRGFKALSDKEGEAYCFGIEGTLHKRTGDLKEARSNYEEALQIYNKAKNQEGKAHILSRLGELYEDGHNYNKAKAYCTKALAINSMLKRTEGEALNMAGLAGIYFAEQDYTQAENFYRQSLTKLRSIGSIVPASFQYGNLALVKRAQGHYKEAQNMHQKGFQLCMKAGNVFCQAWQQKGLAEIAALMGRPDTSKEHALHAKKLFDRSQKPHALETQELDKLLARLNAAKASAVAATPVTSKLHKQAPVQAKLSGLAPKKSEATLLPPPSDWTAYLSKHRTRGDLTRDELFLISFNLADIDDVLWYNDYY